MRPIGRFCMATRQNRGSYYYGGWVRPTALAVLCFMETSSLSSSFALDILNGPTKTSPHRHQKHYNTNAATPVTRGGEGGTIPTALHSTATNDDNSSSESTELPTDFPRRADVLVALAAVRQACRITQDLQPLQGPSTTSTTTSNSNKITTVEKADLSPVTVADYAVQALILHILHSHFSQDGCIAEESSDALRDDEALCQQVVVATRSLTREQTLASLDLGKSYTKWETTPQNRPKRVWCLDPIDGTKGFLRGKHTGGQYAIALSLLEDGIPTIGILGCPNLPFDDDDVSYAWGEEEIHGNDTAPQRGCIFVASRGGGCYQLPLVAPDASTTTSTIRHRQTRGPLSVTPNDATTRSIAQGRFCIGVEKFSDALGQTDAMAEILHGHLDETTGDILYAKRMDSQAKHGVIARGGAEWYVRLPRPGYQEYIWDHAAGNVVIEEAGGAMTDTHGQPLDFSLGPRLSPSVSGILMSNGGVFHTALVASFAQQQAKRFNTTPDDTAT